MSAPFVLPFNHQPVSTTPRSGSYTIPSGKYARVLSVMPNTRIGSSYVNPTISISFSASIAVGAEQQVFSGEGFFWLDVTIADNLGLGTVQFSMRNYDDTNSTFNTIATQATAVSSVNISLGVACTNRVTVLKNSAGTHTWVFTGNLSFSQSNSYFWVPSGTVLNGSSYIVEEFNVLA